MSEIRIPYPIPEPDRTWLIAAGQIACNQEHSRATQRDVQDILDSIRTKYGIEDEGADK